MQKRNPRPLFSAAVLAVAGAMACTPCLRAAEKLVLYGGHAKEATRFQFDNGKFVAPDQAAIDRQDVKEWWISGKQENAQAAAAVAPSGPAPAAADEIQTLTEYRRQGEEMAARLPGCRGVYILDDGTFMLTHDHRHVYRYHFVGLVLNESLVEWGSLKLGFSEGHSRQKILCARSLGPDGQVHVLAPQDIQVSQPQRGDVYFDPDARMMSGTIPGVGVGSVVEYIYEYEQYAPEDWRLFFPGYYFQMDLPLVRSVLTVQVPIGTPLYSWEENWNGYRPAKRPMPVLGALLRWIIPQRSPAKKSCVEVEGKWYDSRTWEKTQVPPIVTEPQMPPNDEVAPAVHASLFKTWDYLNDLTGKLQVERMKVTPEIEAKVAEICAGCTTTEEKVARLYHWVQKNIRYISVKSSLSSGWAGHPATETLAQGYGDCTDKSMLFSTLLRCIGVESDPVVLRTNDEGEFIPKFPVLACNHCITEVQLNGKSMFLDCTSQDHRYPALRSDDHGVICYNFIRDQRPIIPVPPGMLAYGKATAEQMTVTADGNLRVTTANRYSGDYEYRLRAGWKRVPEKARHQILQQFVNGIAPGARLGDFSITDPQDLNVQFKLDFTYDLPSYLIQAKDLRLFQVPDREEEFPEISLDARRYPVIYPTAEATEREIALELPQEFRIVEMPPNVNIRSRHVTYSETWTATGNRVTLRIAFERRSRRIPVADYPEYRRTLQQITAATRRPLYLEATPTAAPAK
ncbi:MAG: hypothetical protein A3K19_20980 [Lentisphaerae bacterium RIFOXYB12_FULL_65_16]|nr:MAG: hypothetical protein A3K18_16475 [Lentisphaerae bacterium RIFOXYA12_64_32]OGV84807.1 MAG: hypothetical protein A3K19_20980 [Lentisphaerae bacterium RIFOXYB12_FULL_65_16]